MLKNLLNTSARGVQPRRVIAALLASALLVQPVLAQGTRSGPTEALPAPVVSDINININATVAAMPASALLAVDQNRGSIIETIVNLWRAELGADATVDELRTSLSALRADNLLAASNARTLDGLKQIFAASDAISKASTHSKADGQKVLGSFTNDTTYTPITPCHLVDTRGTAGYSYAGGAYAASERRTYNSFNFCGPTVSNMAAILVSAVTSYGGSGGGILSMMKNGDPGPITNTFSAGYVPVTTVVPVNGVSPGGLFDVQISGVAGTHVILDVVGYFAAPVATALDCTTVAGVSTTLPANSANTSAPAPACASGYTRVGVLCGTSTNSNRILGTTLSACFNSNESASAATVTTDSVCCRVPGR